MSNQMINTSNVYRLGLVVCLLFNNLSSSSFSEAYSHSIIRKVKTYNNNNGSPRLGWHQFPSMPATFTKSTSLKAVKIERSNRTLKDVKEERDGYKSKLLLKEEQDLTIEILDIEGEYEFNESHSLQYYEDFQNDLEVSSSLSVYDPLNLSNQENNLQETDEDKDKEIFFARCLILIAAALYGTNFTFVKLLGEHVPIGASSAIRFGMAAFVTLPWLIAPPVGDTKDNNKDGKGKASSTASVIRAGMEVGLLNSVGYLAQAEGLQTTDASKSAFICSLAVVFVPILDKLSGKSVPLQKAIGALIAVAGVGVLELQGQSSLSDFSLSHGDLLSLVQPVVFGAGFWKMEQAMHKHPTEAKRLTAGQLLAVAISSVLYCSAGLDGVAPPNLNEIMSYVTDPSILASLFWTGIITTALTIYMETIALKTLSAAETTLIFSTEPLWGAAFASFFVGERFGISAGIGAALIICGCIYSNIEWNNNNEDDDKDGNSSTSISHVNGDLNKIESHLAP